jgi:hypothetical protein
MVATVPTADFVWQIFRNALVSAGLAQTRVTQEDYDQRVRAVPAPSWQAFGAGVEALDAEAPVRLLRIRFQHTVGTHRTAEFHCLKRVAQELVAKVRDAIPRGSSAGCVLGRCAGQAGSQGTVFSGLAQVVVHLSVPADILSFLATQGLKVRSGCRMTLDRPRRNAADPADSGRGDYELWHVEVLHPGAPEDQTWHLQVARPLQPCLPMMIREQVEA